LAKPAIITVRDRPARRVCVCVYIYSVHICLRTCTHEKHDDHSAAALQPQQHQCGHTLDPGHRRRRATPPGSGGGASRLGGETSEAPARLLHSGCAIAGEGSMALGAT
jgi:hypothetical protein